MHSKHTGDPKHTHQLRTPWSTVLATMTTQTIGAGVVNGAVFRCPLLRFFIGIAISVAFRQTAVRGRRRRCCARFRDADMLSPACPPALLSQAT